MNRRGNNKSFLCELYHDIPMPSQFHNRIILLRQRPQTPEDVEDGIFQNWKVVLSRRAISRFVAQLGKLAQKLYYFALDYSGDVE